MRTGCKSRTFCNWAAAVVVTAAAFSPQPAAAQLSAGPITQLIASNLASYPTPAPTGGTGVAWDPINRVFLVVGTCYDPCPYGQVYGLFVNLNGARVGALFSLQTGGGGYFPRATYSPHVNNGHGGFLVVWHEETGVTHLLRTRVVAHSNGTGVKVGSENTINGTAYTGLESGAAVAYSPVSRRFLVAWRVFSTVPGRQVTARLVDINGAPVGGLIRLSSGFGRDPAVAWNSVTNEFGVSFANENSSGTGFMAFAVVNPNTGTWIRNTFPEIAGFTAITDLAFNSHTGRYIMVWHEQRVFSHQVWMSEMAADTSVISKSLVTGSWSWRSYYTLSLAFNPVSGTFLLTGARDPDGIDGAELDGRGLRIGNIVNLAPGVNANNMRASAAVGEALEHDASWVLAFSDWYRALKLVAVKTKSPECRSVKPGPSWLCVDGDWRPPPELSPSGCPIVPLPNPPEGWSWRCVDGTWVLRPLSSSCPSIKPGPDWICVNGDWKPPSVPEPQTLPGLPATHMIAAGHDAFHGDDSAAVAKFPTNEKRPRPNRLSRKQPQSSR